MLADIAVLTGGTVIVEEAGMKLESATFNMRYSKRVVIDKDNTTIVGGLEKIRNNI